MAETWPCPACNAPLGRVDLLDQPPPEVEVYREAGARYCPRCGAPVELRIDLRWTDIALILGLPAVVIASKHFVVPDLMPKAAWAVPYALAIVGPMAYVSARRRRLVRFGERGPPA